MDAPSPGANNLSQLSFSIQAGVGVFVKDVAQPSEAISLEFHGKYFSFPEDGCFFLPGQNLLLSRCVS